MGETRISRMVSGDVQGGNGYHLNAAFIGVPSVCAAPK
jgi:hypothetical protein